MKLLYIINEDRESWFDYIETMFKQLNIAFKQISSKGYAGILGQLDNLKPLLKRNDTILILMEWGSETDAIYKVIKQLRLEQDIL